MNARNSLSGLTVEDFVRLLAALCNPVCYPHPVQRINVVETPISRVILTGT